jgi:hypothetical protein
MSNSTDRRNPFTETKDTQSTIQNLVNGAGDTHRRPQTTARKRALYPSEENRSKITLDLDADTIAALREIARQEGVGRSVSKLAQALLDHALDEYNAGRIQLKLHPVAVAHRLEVTSQNAPKN